MCGLPYNWRQRDLLGDARLKRYRPGTHRTPFVPSLEWLEDRCVLSNTVTVLTAMDLPPTHEAGPTPGVFRFIRTGDLSEPLTVNYTLGGTATLGTDYIVWENTANFEAGSDTAYVAVCPLNDFIPDINETITISIASGTGYTIGTPNTAQHIIGDAFLPNLPGVHDFDEFSLGIAHDMRYLDAFVGNGMFGVTVGLAAQPSIATATNIEIYLDTDQNASTGDVREGGIHSAEYRLKVLAAPIVGGYELYRLPTSVDQSNEQLIQSGSIILNGPFVSVNLQQGLIGNPAAVDVFAFSHAGDLPHDIVGNGDRAPDFGVFNTATRQTALRRPGKTRVVSIDDPLNDKVHPNSFDITNVRYLSMADQFFFTLTFSQNVNPTTVQVEAGVTGQITLDSDDSKLTGGIALGAEIPTWGGDANLVFAINGPAPTLQLSFDNSGNNVPFGATRNDGRWIALQQRLFFIGSLSILDSFLIGSQGGQPVYARSPADGDLVAFIQTFFLLAEPGDTVPTFPEFLDTSTGDAVPAYMWDPNKVIQVLDPVEFGALPIDIQQVDAQVIEGNLVVKTTLGSLTTSDVGYLYELLLDTDNNSNTGEQVANLGGPTIGADYRLEVISLDTGTIPAYVARLFHPNGLVTIHEALVRPNFAPGQGIQGSFTVTVPFAELPPTGPQVAMYVTAGQFQGVSRLDIAPPAPMVIDLVPQPGQFRFSATNYVVDEDAGIATITVERQGGSAGQVTVDFEVTAGTAVLLEDYDKPDDGELSGTLTFADGEVAKTFKIKVIDDSAIESEETVQLTLSNPTGGATLGEPNTATMTIIDDDRFTISDFTATQNGFIITFNAPVDTADINLYNDVGGTLGSPDVDVRIGGTTRVFGSVVWNADRTQMTFIQTGGVLINAEYSVTLKSGPSAFKDGSGNALDGNGDGTPGDDFSATFNINASGPGVIVPDFARGAGQSVNVPASSTDGIPLRITEGANVTSITFELLYDPALINFTDIALGADAPTGATVDIDTSTPGVAVITFNSATALSGGLVNFANLIAHVPDDAPYASKHVLDITKLQVNGGAITARDDDGLHIAAYLGDTSGNQRISGLDASFAAQYFVNSNDPDNNPLGFLAYKMADPRLVGDTSGNGIISGLDASFIAQEFVNPNGMLNIPNIPDLGTPPDQGGPDPRLFIEHTSGQAGDTISVAVCMEVTDPQGVTIEAIDLVIGFDPLRFTVDRTSVQQAVAGILPDDYLVLSSVDSLNGRLLISMATSTPDYLSYRAIGELIRFDLQVKSSAGSGLALLDLREDNAGQSQPLETAINEGRAVLLPRPTNANPTADHPLANMDAGVDGVFTIIASDESVPEDKGLIEGNRTPVSESVEPIETMPTSLLSGDAEDRGGMDGAVADWVLAQVFDDWSTARIADNPLLPMQAGFASKTLTRIDLEDNIEDGSEEIWNDGNQDNADSILPSIAGDWGRELGIEEEVNLAGW